MQLHFFLKKIFPSQELGTQLLNKRENYRGFKTEQNKSKKKKKPFFLRNIYSQPNGTQRE